MEGEPGQEDHKESEANDEGNVPGNSSSIFLHRKDYIRQSRNT